MDYEWLIKTFGLPIGGAIIVLILGHRKAWCFGYQLVEKDTLIAEKKVEITELKADIVNLRASYEARLEGCQNRENEWRELALTGGQVAKDALGVMKRRG